MKNSDVISLLNVLISRNVKFTKEDIYKDFAGILQLLEGKTINDIDIADYVESYLDEMIDTEVLMLNNGIYVNINKKEKMGNVKRNLIDENIDDLIDSIDENILLVNNGELSHKDMILRLLDFEIEFAKASRYVLDYHKEFNDVDLADKSFFIWKSDKKLLELYMKRSSFNNLVYNSLECREFLGANDVINLFIDIQQSSYKGTYNVSNDNFIEEIKEKVLKETIDLYYDLYYVSEDVDVARVSKLNDNFEYYCLFAGEQENYFDTASSRIVVGPQFGDSINSLVKNINSKIKCNQVEKIKI